LRQRGSEALGGGLEAAAGRHGSVLEAMRAMNAASRVIAPTRGAVARFHAAKYRVFHRMHADFLAHRELMAQAG
jgi:ribulose kinase